jgi:hypothetical protein
VKGAIDGVKWARDGGNVLDMMLGGLEIVEKGLEMM